MIKLNLDQRKSLKKEAKKLANFGYEAFGYVRGVLSEEEVLCRIVEHWSRDPVDFASRLRRWGFPLLAENVAWLKTHYSSE